MSTAVAVLGLYLLGQRDAAIYDGSWSEWGGVPGVPIATT